MACTGNQNSQFSSSWSYDYNAGPDPNTAFDTEFQKMAAQGQSFFQASGDGDAWVNPVSVPSDSPYVTSVGGTFLTLSNSGAGYISETVWNSGNLGANDVWGPNGNGYWGSGGGISTVYPISSWQQGLSMSANDGSTNMRNIPDVALTAYDVWVIYNNGESDWFMGTSCAAPLWAAFVALANQRCRGQRRHQRGLYKSRHLCAGPGNKLHGLLPRHHHRQQHQWPESGVLPGRFRDYDLCAPAGGRRWEVT